MADEYDELLKEINKAADGITDILSNLNELEDSIKQKEQYYKTKGYLSSTESKCKDYEMTLTKEVPPTLKGLKAHFEGLRHHLSEINKLIKKRGRAENAING